MTRPVETTDPKQVEANLAVRDRLDLQESELRRQVAQKITWAFLAVNGCVIALVLLAIGLDHYFIHQKHMPSSERLVTTHLLMTIIGATTVQLGAIAFAM